jgi:TrmH family RNA methyltransferase
MKSIVSRDNPTFKHLRTLVEDVRYRRDQRATILDGPHLIQSALAHAVRLRRIAVTSQAMSNPEIAAIVERAAQSTCELLEFGEPLLRSVSPVESPSGIVAEIEIPSPQSAVEQVEDMLVLSAIQDVGNLGALLRTAVAVGIRRVWLSPDCTQAWSPKVLRAGMGAHFVMQIEEQIDLHAKLQNYAGQVIATALSPAATNLFALDLAPHTAWLFGSEGQGLSAQLRDMAHHTAMIPMPGGTESLNVGASAAVCLFEQLRQRTAM